MRQRGGLAMLMLGSFAVGMVLMIVFEATITRVAGIAALVTFMVSGLFLVADPAMLDPDDDDDGEAGEAEARLTER